MQANSEQWFAEILHLLVSEHELSPQHMRAVMERMMSGQCSDMETATLLVALRKIGRAHV